MLIRRLRGLAGLLVLLAVAAGFPAAMAATIGNPLHQWASIRSGDMSDQDVIAILAGVAWLAWATFVVAFLAELAELLAAAIGGRQRRTFSIPLLGQQQDLARSLIAAVLLLAPVAAGVLGAAGPVFAAPPAAAGMPAHLAARTQPTAPVADRATVAAATAARPTASYVIPSSGGMRSYWDLAVHYLGDGQRWPQIWQANEGRVQPGGQIMDSPGLLRPGWSMLIPLDPPAAATTGAGQHDVVVRSGDTLSGLAAADGVRDWRSIWPANAGRREPGGQQLTDPNLIRPGWTVDLPAVAAAAITPPAPRPAAPAAPAATAAALVPPATPPPTAPVSSVAPPVAPLAPSGALPTAVPAGTAQGSGHRAETSSAVDEVVAFGAGGGLLAAVTLAGLLVNRRRQFRWRRPGRAIVSGAQIPPGLRRIERALLAAADAGGPDVRWLDAALRGLAATIKADPDGRLPDVLAVRMAGDVLELVLAGPHPNPPAPWTANTGGRPETRWAIRRSDTPPLTAEVRARQFAPYPMLASVGHTAEGDQWLLDLERVGALSLAGDRDRCLDLARFVAAELAHNSWSEMLRVTLAGFGEQLAALNPDRVHYTDDPVAAARQLAHQHAGVSAAAADLQVDVLHGRLHGIDGDVWAPHALLIAPDEPAGAVVADLLATMSHDPGRSCVAVLIVADQQPPGAADRPESRWTATVTADGRLRLPRLGVELIAQQLPAAEAAGITDLLAASMRLEDLPMPPAWGNAAYDALADAAGALRAGVCDRQQPTAGRGQLSAVPPPETSAAQGHGGGNGGPPPPHAADTAPWVANSMLPLPPQTYLERTSAAAEDLAAVAPAVPDEVARRLRAADPKLAADLAAWNDPACPRPKLRLLGPVGVSASGQLPPARPRTGWHTEVVVYLALHPDGVTMGQCVADLFPGEAEATASAKVRKAISTVRSWLGTDPAAGTEYLPLSRRGGAQGGGTARYSVPDLLVDAELFRRLRLHAAGRGADGIEDLWTALRLVTGTPLDHGRDGGYSWQAERHDDHVYASMVFDTAHTVAVHHLGAADPVRAIEAAQVALLAGSQEDTPLLDMMFACDARGDHSQGDTYRQLVLSNHDVELPEDCPPPTSAALRKRERMRRAAS